MYKPLIYQFMSILLSPSLTKRRNSDFEVENTRLITIEQILSSPLCSTTCVIVSGFFNNGPNKLT